MSAMIPAINGADAEVPCTWKTLDAKAEHDLVLTSGGAVTEIEFQGKTQTIDF